MARFSAFRNRQSFEEPHIWDNLKQAIAASSGFQRWQMELLPLDTELQKLGLDYQVRRYLRETLETLAY